jgi:hypothetical protein
VLKPTTPLVAAKWPSLEPVAPLVELASSDISSASGLDPAAVAAAAQRQPAALAEGDGGS